MRMPTLQDSNFTLRRLLTPWLGVTCGLVIASAAAAEDAPQTRKAATQAHGLAPAAAAAAMTLPPGFTVKLLAAEPEVRQPIAMAFDDRGRLWVAEAYSYPDRVPDADARDRILILEDTDDDHVLDSRKVFAERLNLVSGLEVGFGGVFVGAAPHCLFIPDRDGNDVPDGPPEILLDGWGYEDTHETLNGFTWGPDGWLYGCHGVATHSRVGKPGTADAERVPLNAAIWRFHPVRREFEVFSEGTSNPWGIDFDDLGQAFHTACVIPHLYHDVPGGRYLRQVGSHFEPFTYADIQTIARHRHWAGGSWHRAEQADTDASGGGHAHSGAMIYLGGAWPDRYRGRLFMNNIHGDRLNVDRLTPAGSGFIGEGDPDFLFANDTWSQFISLQYGPDGQVVLLDWYDAVQCHQQRELVDKENGRIFKVLYRGDAVEPAAVRVDLAARTDAELIDMLAHRNEWFVRHARRLLQERAAAGKLARDTASLLRERLASAPTAAAKLRVLWAAHAVGAADVALLEGLLADPEPAVRGWAVRLAAERRTVPANLRDRFAVLAGTDASPVVRLAIASALQRMPPGDRWATVAALAGHAEDASDHNLPLMIWYAAEPLVPLDPRRALGLAVTARIPQVARFVVRRAAADAAGWPALVERLAESDDAARDWMLDEVLATLATRGGVPVAEAWRRAAAVSESADPAVRFKAALVAVRLGDAAAVPVLRAVLADRAEAGDRRQRALEALVAVKDAGTPSVAQGLLDDAAIRAAVIKALAALPAEGTAAALVAAYGGLPAELRRDAIAALVSRPAWVPVLLDAVASGTVPREDLPAATVQRLAESDDPALVARLNRVWGTIRLPAADKQAELAAWRKRLPAQALTGADLTSGRRIFERTCGNCHALHGVGGRVGPELTGANRGDVGYLLANLLDPSAVVGRDYQMTTVVTTDGRSLQGIVVADSANSITLRNANNDDVVVPTADVEERVLSEKSLMPENLLGQLSPEQTRDLIAYLRHPTQVPLPTTDATPPAP